MPSPFSILAGPSPFSMVPTAQEAAETSEAELRTRKRTALMSGVAALPLDNEAALNVGQAVEAAGERYDQIGEEQIRLEAGMRRQQARAQALQDLEPGVPGVREALGDTLMMAPEDAARGALEDEYADQLFVSAQMNPSNPSPEPEYFDIFQSMADREAKRMVWERLTNDIGEEREDRMWINAVGEAIFLQGIPARNSMTQTGVLRDYGLTQDFWDNLLAGGAVREESAQFHQMMDAMSTDEFEVFATTLAAEIRRRNEIGGFTDLSFTQEMMENLLDAPPGWYTNAINAVDNLPFGAAVVRGGRSIVRSSIRMGSRGNAADLITTAVNRGSREGSEAAVEAIGADDVGEVFGPLSPSAINPHGSPSDVSIALDVDDRLRAAEDLLASLQAETAEGFVTTRRLASDEAVRAQDAAEAALNTRAGREAVDVDVRTTQLPDGSVVDEVVGTFGRKDGLGGYTTTEGMSRAARAAGINLDLKDPSQVILSETGEWFFRASMPIRETGSYTTKLESNASNIFSTFLLNGRINADRSLTAAAVLAEGTAARVQREVVEGFGTAIRRIPSRERNIAAQIWQEGNNAAHWFSRSEFEEEYLRHVVSGDSSKAWEAYQLTQKYNDIDYLVRRDYVWKTLHTQGYQSLEVRAPALGGDDLIAREVDRISGDFMDVNTGEIFREGTSYNLPSGHIAVRLQVPTTTAEGWAVRTAVGPRSSFQFAPLRRDVLAYREGGHRMPQGSHFVKQAARHTQPDGSEILMSPRAFIAARNAAEATEWAKHMEEVRRILLDADDLRDPEVYRKVAQVIEGRPGYPGVDELIDDAVNGKMNLRDPFEVVQDRGIPSAYRGGRTLDGAMYDPDEVADITWARSKGGMYYGSKGEEVIRDWQGEAAPTLNMMQVMQRSLGNISQLMSFGDYKMESLARFRQTYGQAGHGALSETRGMSDMDFLMNAPLKPNLPEALRQGMAANRNQIRRILNVPSQNAELTQRVQRQFTDFMAGSDPRSTRARAVTRVAEWWQDKDGVSALRDAAFDLKLGLFNIAQLPLQISTTLAATSMSPKFGMQGVLNMIPARVNMLNPNTLETLISRGVHKMVGMEAAEYRSYMGALRQSGFFKIKGSHSLMAETGPTAAMDGFSSGVQQVRDTGRFFFYEAETANRLVAAHIAWRELREGASELDFTSPEFRRQWMGRVDDYSFNMSNSSRAEWQKGVLSVPTQFWSYPVRMMEAMLGSNFTRQQRAQLLIGQSLLYGPAVAVPGASLVAYLGEKAGITEPEADTPELRSLRGFYDRGFLDIMTNVLSGGELDVRIGARIGVGELPEQIVRDFFGDPEFGDASAMNLVGGATWSIWNDIGEDFYQVGQYAIREAGQERMPATVENLRRLALNASSISNITKAYMIHNYGRLVSSEFRHLADVPSEYALAAALSVQPNILAEVSQDFAYVGKDNELVDELADLISLHRRRLVDAETPAERAALSEDIALITQLFSPDIVVRARQKVGNAFIDDIATSVSHSSQRREQEERFSDALEALDQETED